MGLLSSIIAKGVVTAARNSTIKAAGDAAATLIATKASADAAKDDIVVKNGVTLIKPTIAEKMHWKSQENCWVQVLKALP